MTAGVGARRARKKNKGKKEQVVPPIWAATKAVDPIWYKAAEEVETLGEQCWPAGWEPHYRVGEEEGAVPWHLEEVIPELEYGHATLEEVQFEWGRSNRCVRYIPDVRGKEIKPQKPIKLKEARQERLEMAMETVETVPEVEYQTCSVLRGGQNPALRVATEREITSQECEEETKSAKNTKYFCMTCDANRCNSCFTQSCMSHKVQWIPYCSTFLCLSCPVY